SATHQSNVDWDYWWGQGKRFAYVKATEATSYTNPYFAQQYIGSYDIGMIRGAYHFAVPNSSSGRAQANYFVDNGGGWSGDGKRLSGALDMEYNPYGADPCYGRSEHGMVRWIKNFSKQLHSKTGRWPMIYTTTDWWKTCTGNTPRFGSDHPLFIARYNDRVGELPNGWPHYTLWQY
ncbi:GH25 family lysozyme, partial [Kitasatospora nipponensis]|uniref:GH25 family lysozyme n=1 Tax=Kitasatospora nipponensis TaxID=258049 RepID=UPI0031D73E0B